MHTPAHMQECRHACTSLTQDRCVCTREHRRAQTHASSHRIQPYPASAQLPLTLASDMALPLSGLPFAPLWIGQVWGHTSILRDVQEHGRTQEDMQGCMRTHGDRGGHVWMLRDTRRHILYGQGPAANSLGPGSGRLHSHPDLMVHTRLACRRARQRQALGLGWGWSVWPAMSL